MGPRHVPSEAEFQQVELAVGLEPHAYDKAVMSKLWDRSKKETGFEWNI